MAEFVQRSGEETLLRSREMLEVSFGLGGVLGVSWWLPEAWRPSHLVFCALFIVVVAIAVRHHTLVAYGSSSLAAVGYGLLLWLHPALHPQSDFLYLALEPFLLLLSGICISDLLRWQRHRLALVEQKYAFVDSTLQTVQEKYQAAIHSREKLERQVTGQSTSLAIVSERLAQLWSLQGKRRGSAVVDILASALEAQSCAFYVNWNGSFRLYASSSIDTFAHAPLLGENDPLLRRVVEQRKVITIRDSLLEMRELAPAGAVMAGPLFDQAGEIMGVVLIGHLSLFKFNSGVVHLFRSLLQMISLSFQTAGLLTLEQDLHSDLEQLDPERTEPSLLTQRTSILP